jgi:hypothetical protein
MMINIDGEAWQMLLLTVIFISYLIAAGEVRP